MTKAETAQQLDDIRKKLSQAGSKESAFITVELLFYDALTVARTDTDDPMYKEILLGLKRVEANEFKAARELFRKTNQKELAIRRFIVQFKTVLVAGIRQLSQKEKPQAGPGIPQRS